MKLSTDHEAMKARFQTVCLESGLSALVLLAIWYHETDGGTSALWKDAINPAGIKYASGFFITTPWGRATNLRDARYPNRSIAAAVLVLFLRQSRYSRAWGKDDLDQVREIAMAGFVEHGGIEPANWIAGVTGWLKFIGGAK